MSRVQSQDFNNKPLYYSDVRFIKPETSVFHGFFGRQGGVSDDIYTSLNCGYGSDDLEDRVSQNRKIVSNRAGIALDRLVSVYQCHTDICHYIDTPWPVAPRGDALVTDVGGVALGILTADCAPVLFYGEKENGAPVIGAAHAGWRGAIGGVLETTIDKMVERAAALDSIKAIIGPCIGQSSYEVSEDFNRNFLERDESYEHFFKDASKKGHYMFDLAGFGAMRLKNAGVNQVIIMDKDTYALENSFFSYRRTTHRGEANYGRQISVISIQS